MKRFRFFMLAIFALTVSGCYTQLAIEERRPDRSYSYENYGDQEYTESDTIYYDEDENSGKVINNYYIVPGYRRYFWHYYPSTSIVIGTGYYFDFWFWDTWYPRWWYCDPWYPPVAYYPFWYYHPNYYYYGGYYWDNYYTPKTYKYRNDNISRIRNNEGGRGSSFTTRDAIKAYDRNRPSTRERIGAGESIGTRERTATRETQGTRPGSVSSGRTGVTRDENQGTVRERNRTTDPGSSSDRRPVVRPKERENDRQPSGVRKPVYIPRKRETEQREPSPSREPERRRVVPNDNNSGRRSSPPPSYNPPSNSGGSRQSAPPSRSGGSSGSSSRSGSSNDSPRRSR